MKKCLYCNKEIKRCRTAQKYHKSCLKDHYREYNRDFAKKPEQKEKRRKYARKYCKLPKVRKRMREYARRPEVKARQKEHNRKYLQRPEVRERIRIRVKMRRWGKDFWWNTQPIKDKIAMGNAYCIKLLKKDKLDIEEICICGHSKMHHKNRKIRKFGDRKICVAKYCLCDKFEPIKEYENKMR